MGSATSSNSTIKSNNSGKTDSQTNLSTTSDYQNQSVINRFKQGVQYSQANFVTPEQQKEYYNKFLSYFNSDQDKQNSLKNQAIQYVEMIKINNFQMPSPEELILLYKSQKNMPLIPLYDYFQKYKFYQYLKQNQGVSSTQKQSDETAQYLKQAESQIKAANYDIKQCGKNISLYILTKSQIKNTDDNSNNKQQTSQVNLNSKIQINDDNNKENNPNQNQRLDKIQQHLAFTGQKYFYYTLPIVNDHKFNGNKALNEKEQFGQHIKEFLIRRNPNIPGLNPEKILIVEVIYDPLTVNFICDIELPGMNLLQLAQPTKINENYFDPKWNMSWNGGQDTRGQINGKPKEYYLPSKEYFGFGLNIVENYPKDGWFGLGDDNKTWIVLYHKQPDISIDSFGSQDLLRSSIVKYSEEICRFGRGKVGSGMYLADKIENCLSHDNNKIQIGDKKYEFIYQCRVNPKTIKSPKSQPNLFVASNPRDIRPYRLLIREIK